MDRARDLAADPDFDPSFDELIDFQQVTEIKDFRSADARQLAAIGPWGANSRRAAVMPDDLQYGLARMYEAYNEATGSRLSVFRTVEEAKRWLEKGTHK